MGKFIAYLAAFPVRILVFIASYIRRGTKTAEKTKELRKLRTYWRILGPGLTTGAADDDPSGIATYSQSGAVYGFQFLWLAPFTVPFMSVVQEMCARLGLVTGRGLAANIRHQYPKWVLITITILLTSANIFNIGVDLAAMAKATELLTTIVPYSWLLVLYAGMTIVFQLFFSYQAYARFLKYLSFILVAYIFSAFMVPIAWPNVLSGTLIPSVEISRDQILMLCAILGTSISPYLFFWQTSQEVEEEILKGRKTLKARVGASHTDIRNMRIDVWSGMFFSQLIMFFIILACGAVLFGQGVGEITTAAQAAAALRPFAGEYAYIFFTVGIIGTGLLAVPVLAGSAAYAVSESFGWKEGLFRTMNQASSFYGVIILSVLCGLGINALQIDPMRALIYSAIANGLIAPVVLVTIVQMSSNKKLMGRWVNGPVVASIGWMITVLMAIVAVLSIGFLMLQSLQK